MRHVSQTVWPVVIIIIFAVLTWPVWRWLWGEWMSSDYYSHGVLIPFISLFLAIQRIRNAKALPWIQSTHHNLGLVFAAISLLLFIYFFQDKAYYLAAFAIVGMICGMVWTFGGIQTIGALAFPVGYLLLMIPLPFIERSTLPLAMFTGVCSGSLVQLLGMDIEIVGNAVTLPNANLVIGAQCSGVNSIIALIALTALTAYLLESSWLGKIGLNRILLVILSIPLAMLGNILRVSSLLFVARSYGADAAFTFYHDYSGPIFFVLILLLIWPLTRLLRFGDLRTDVI